MHRRISTCCGLEQGQEARHVAGDTKGAVWLFLNVGTRGKPRLAEGKQVEADGKPIIGSQRIYKRVDGKLVLDKTIPGNHTLAEKYSKLHIADWNADGLDDLLIGHDDKIVLYVNVGKRTEPRFGVPVKIVNPQGRFPSRPSPTVVDWDGDGKQDLLVGCESAQVLLYRNVGTKKEPKLAKGEDLKLVIPADERGYRWRLTVADWNNDKKMDILLGNRLSSRDRKRGGNIWLFLGK
jgi:FG-GAP-like repeat